MATHGRTRLKQHGLAFLMPLEEQSRESEMDGLDIELCELRREFGPTWPNEKRCREASSVLDGAQDDGQCDGEATYTWDW